MRKIWDIHGGIHPEENKHQSTQAPIAPAGIAEELILPLSQHIGAPATVIVSVGQQVLKGQKLAEASGYVSTPIHASTSGEVIAIENRVISHPSGMSAPCVVLRPDGRDQWADLHPVADYRAMDKTELLERIREAGIAGMGGAGFPAAVKLNTQSDKPIDTLILNGTECEPYITADDVLMRERADEIIAGTQVLQHLVAPTGETLLGIEDNKPEAITALEKAARNTDIQIVTFPTKYPSGGEKQLIEILTGREVPSGGLPADVGIVCQNVGTAVAIHRAVAFGEPLVSRITTVTGEACKEQRNFEVLLGTPIGFLLERCGFDLQRSSRVVIGGPMMGFAVESLQVPVVKTTNCILAPSTKEQPPPPPAQPCIRCGLCSEACPASLLPQQLYWFARGKEYDKLEDHNLMDCIECGACSYVCPSHIPLVQYYRAAKADIRQQKIDAENAEHAKARFEARKARLEREQAEKEARRAARKAAAQSRAQGGGDDKADAVQAAVERAKAKKAETDPAQAAIEKARARRAQGDDSPATKEDLEQALASAEKRLATAEEKLQQAEQTGSEKIDAFRTGVEKTRAKVEKARAELETFLADNAAPQSGKAQSTDPAQAAIERARAKRADQANKTPLEKAQQAVASLQQRIDKAQDKYQKAKAENSDKLDILASSLEGLKDKLATAQQELASLQGEQAPETEAPDNPPADTGAEQDPAADAIARALAKRDAASSMTDEQRLQNAVDSIGKRLEKARTKLAQAEANDDDNLELLLDAVQKLELKLADAQQAQRDYQQAPQ